MLWTGGKDSSLALFEAGRDGYDVRCLVTFAPLYPKFLAHPPVFIKMQAQVLALPHYHLSISTLVTDGPSFTRSIRIRSHSKRTRDLLVYMEIHELELAAL